MKRNAERKIDTTRKVLLTELKSNPFVAVKIAFAVIGLIPLMVFLYIILGENLNYQILLGNSGLLAVTAIIISVMGFLYSYQLIVEIVKKLLMLFNERKSVENEKMELVIGVLHDLMTPLSIIKMGISNLQDSIVGPLNKEQDEIVKISLRAADRLSTFIEELKEISKEHITRTDLRRSHFDFSKLVEDEIGRISKSNTVEIKALEYKKTSADTMLWADQKKISIALAELLYIVHQNALPSAKIEIALMSDSNTVKLTLIVGQINWPDELGEIFLKYDRPEEHAGVKGAGLNLSIVKDIVDMHNGHISVERKTDNSIECELVLPRDLRA